MNSNLFAARNTPRDFHWAWYLAPLGTIAIALLTEILATMLGEGPAPTLAATAMPIAAKNTAVGPAPATQPF